MARRVPTWENEFWSYISNSDGLTCPVFTSCQYRLNGYTCICDYREHSDTNLELLNNDDLDISTSTLNARQLDQCFIRGRIFQLGAKIAEKYRNSISYHYDPVTDQVLINNCRNITVEVRHVPLKKIFGAVWQIQGCWVIQLNSNSTSARQRFTLYHEIFHILAHNFATPAFKKPFSRKGMFNEILADHFAAISLMPKDLLTAKWKETQDLNKMVDFFSVPTPIIYQALQILNLI